MKGCKGCRYLFEDMALDNKPHEFCRAAPPPMHVIQKDDGKREYVTLYPLAPRLRCGQYTHWWAIWR